MMRRKDESRIPEMTDVLMLYGDVPLAEDYMNCGQPDLADAGRRWASARGYSFGIGNGSHRAVSVAGAAGKVMDREVSTKLAVNGLHLSEQADRALLERVSRAAGDQKVRDAARFRMDALRRTAALDLRMAPFRGAAALAQAALADADPVVRFAALARLSDQTSLAKVAAEAKDFGVRRTAAARISDAGSRQAMLERLDALVPRIGQEYSVDLGAASAVTLLWIPPTSGRGFLMGSPANEEDRFVNERQHAVVLTKGFWMGKTMVTQAQWAAVMETFPSHNEGDDLPVEQVSWDDAVAYCQKLTERERAAGRLPEGYEYALPTEAQWEYACRAGSTGPYSGDLDAMAWYGTMAWYGNKPGNTTPAAGARHPNPWGLYDMHGPVWEWCWDWFGDYPGESVTDPTGPAQGSYRVYRGGSSSSGAVVCRSAYRCWSNPSSGASLLGFRLALAPRIDR
jgi:formylglycine-generating enzyme required for sulfatase activity